MPLYRRVPKLKHFEIINQKSFSILNLSKLNEFKDGEIVNQKNFSIVNLSKLNEFKDSDVVNLDALVKKKVLFKPKFPLKILGNGEVKVKLKVQAHAFTKVAKEKIEAAGGSCEIINNK